MSIVYSLEKYLERKKSSVHRHVDDTCRPHSWCRAKDIVSDSIALELEEIIKDRTDLQSSIIQCFSTGLTCSKCGYISGTEVSLKLDKWPLTVRSFIFSEKQKELVEKYLKD